MTEMLSIIHAETPRLPNYTFNQMTNGPVNAYPRSGYPRLHIGMNMISWNHQCFIPGTKTIGISFLEMLLHR